VLYSSRAMLLCAGLSAALAMLSGHVRAGTLIAAVLPTGSNSASATSWLAGAHAGYNWQRGNAVFGFETDLQATHLNSTMSGGLMPNPPGLPLPPGDFAMTSSTINWYGTARGRLGFASGPLLLYGTAGLAYGNVGLNSTFSSTIGATRLLLNSQASETKLGWVAGVGAEYLIKPNLSARIGYQYVDLGSLSVSATSPPAPFMIGQQATANARFQAVIAGLTWHFTPMGMASPWQGGYAGGHAGGAWGNNTNASYDSQSLPSDVRLKRDVNLVGRLDNGLGLYSYRYLWSADVYVGVMAQEVALIRPDAVQRDPLTGYLGVDYRRLGLSVIVE
jgi:outer membrane immunogenic protein